ncbi:HlyD family secretion protein [Bythopirellula polymerisocia]|uniref:Inner membrane protein YibH n=1 Tax=Bythopirellula polymerisocia TaxID=2528003 RepID=A0A5C6CTJ6_9BACT|nr:efflux RND transporter periplasmic adaptor subunit [Bythopirellula polymerisocia]TWU26059.1 Inner membrane protein YibH [Bythopirellula polymerisocia]
MMWLVGGLYCLVLWLVFAKWKLMRLSLPLAIITASIGPAAILAVLFCMQYFHPYTSDVHVFQKFVPIIPQLKQMGRVSEIYAKPNEAIKKGEPLFDVDKVPYENSVQRLRAAPQEVEQQIKVAESSIESFSATVRRATADLKYATNERDRSEKLVGTEAISQEEYERSLTRYEDAVAALAQANAGLRQAEISVELGKAQLEQTQTQLADAKYDLEQTTIVAPGDGYITNLQLQSGMLVGGVGANSVLTFVADRDSEEQGVVVATFGQKNYLLIEPGNYAEVALADYPGEVFTGKVLTTIDVTSAGQLDASGNVPSTLRSQEKTRFAVRIKLDDCEDLRMPAGSQGHAAVYTDHAQIAGIPMMVLVRMKSWLGYLF